MKKPERKRCEMFRRVDEFGNVYRDLFPADSVAGQAFHVVKTVVSTLGEETVATMRVKRGGQFTRKSAREALIKRLEAMARFAQAMGESKPGFKETFQFPADTSDQALIAAGRLFAH